MALSIYEWATGTRVRFMQVPWEADYKDVVYWTPEQRDAYFDAHEVARWTIDNMQYLRAGEAITVPIPYDDIWRVNYCVVDNESAPFANEKPIKLCYFVTSIVYQAPNSTLIDLQLDVWQTYALTMLLGTCYVERGHVVMESAHNWQKSISDYDLYPQSLQKYFNEPEGLDVGSEYTVSRHFYEDLSNVDGKGVGVMVVSTADLESNWGTLESPNLDTSRSRVVDGLPSGAGVYFFTSAEYSEFTAKCRTSPWISKAVTMAVGVPAALISGDDADINGTHAIRVASESSVRLDNIEWDGVSGFKNIFNSMGRLDRFGKFFTYPYMYYEMDTGNGSPVLLKPELVGQNGALQFAVETVVVPPHTRVAIYPINYGFNQAVAHTSPGVTPGSPSYEYATFTGKQTRNLIEGQGLNCAAWVQGFPQFSLVNDEYLNYLASTKNTREAQYAGAGWSLERSNASAELAYNQAQTNFQYSVYDNEIRNQQFQNSLMGSVGNAALGALGQAASLNFGGALSTVGSTAINSAVGIANNELTNQSFYNNATKDLALAGQNRGLAEWANQGDYQQAIRTLNATVRDAALTQPSMSGAAGGEGFAMATGNFGVNLRVMTIAEGRARAIADYWARYGYACNRYVTINKNLNLMTKYTYWKCADTYVIDFDGDESSKSVIRGILERGVTVWRSPDEIGLIGIQYSNEVDETVPALY